MSSIDEWTHLENSGVAKGTAEMQGLRGANAARNVARVFAAAHNDFASALFACLRGQTGNLFLSPLSIRTALAMTWGGARGETAVEMGRALRLSTQGEDAHALFGRTIRRLNAGGGDCYEMAVANSIWCQDGALPLDEFRDMVASHYEGGIEVVDFRRQPKSACGAINRWVETRTNDRIRDLVQPDDISPETRMVLVNAVYFNGLWLRQFPQGGTQDEVFHLTGGGEVRSPFMHQETVVSHHRGDSYQAIELDYRGSDLSMLILLPDDRDGLDALEGQLSAREIENCVSGLAGRPVKLWLPRFSLSWRATDLIPALREIGISRALTSSEADFSGINGVAPGHPDSFFIGDVLHAAFVDVNEGGTEAAAATAVLHFLGPSWQPESIEFRADHPFLFVIRELATGAIVFLGRVSDPTRQG